MRRRKGSANNAKNVDERYGRARSFFVVFSPLSGAFQACGGGLGPDWRHESAPSCPFGVGGKHLNSASSVLGSPSNGARRRLEREGVRLVVVRELPVDAVGVEVRRLRLRLPPQLGAKLRSYRSFRDLRLFSVKHAIDKHRKTLKVPQWPREIRHRFCRLSIHAHLPLAPKRRVYFAN